MMVIACYSIGTPYEAESALLSASLKRVNMSYHLHGFPDYGGWYANTAYKAEFIRAQRDLRTGPLLYVDVDAFVHENCSAYFDALDADFGAHWFAGPAFGNNRRHVCACVRGAPCNRDHRLLSGTLFFGDTAGARHLLDAWCAFNAARRAHGDPTGGGQRNLFQTWQAVRGEIVTARLPGRYTFVFDKVWSYPAGEPCIIEHLIASRDHRPNDDGRAKTTTNAARAARMAELQRLVKR
jgi:hypothetical protein